MTDLLGPGDAGAINPVTTTGDVSNPNAADTWFQDCVNGNPTTGTNLVSRFENRFLQQLRRVIRLSGVALANTNDDMLGQAIQSGAANWCGTFGGTANALTATLSPAPASLIPGLKARGIVAAGNTGSTTLNVNGLGNVAVRRSDNTACLGGELVAGGEAEFTYNGTYWIEVDLPPSMFTQRVPQLDWYVDNTIGSDSIYDGTSASISGAHGPWATLQHAAALLGNYNFGGQTVTIHLGTGGAYAGPVSVGQIASGVLVVKGSLSSPSSYVISGTAASGLGLVNVGGALTLEGLSLANQAADPTTVNLNVANGGVVNLNNVVFGGLAGSLAHILVGENASVAIGVNCVFSQSALNCLIAANSGSIVYFASMSVTGTPQFGDGSGNPAHGAFANANVGGTIASSGTGTWTVGGSATGPRYYASLNGVISTLGGGANLFPGSVAGATATGGQYA